MYSFKNDYSEGAHPEVLKLLLETNMEQTESYGLDPYSVQAKQIIKSLIQREDADIHLIPGGTQTNLITISSFLRPHEAVISAATGHILVHETGAIEATGHKVLSVETADGKLRPADILGVVHAHTDEHMVKPRLVYISNSTEIGSIYRRKELEELHACCRENSLLLYMDGARLGSALCSDGNDVELSDIGRLTDAFYIGGTKNGALLGEALVICNASLKNDFRFFIKQKGALLAKGRILGIQFLALFRDGLYFRLAKHANDMASLLHRGIQDAGYAFFSESPSNQIFPILPNRLIQKLLQRFGFYIWKEIDSEHSAVRLVTSWATEREMVLRFVDEVKSFINDSY
jgi:threonine aldolase